jgi:hypothetical protein
MNDEKLAYLTRALKRDREEAMSIAGEGREKSRRNGEAPSPVRRWLRSDVSPMRRAGVPQASSCNLERARLFL